MAKYLRDRARFVVFDVNCDYELQLIDEGISHAIIQQPGELIEYLRARRTADFFGIVYQPFEQPEEHAQHVFRLLVDFQRSASYPRPLTLAIDEVQEICNGANPHGAPEILRTIMRTGGHQMKISVIATSQRPAEVPRNITANSGVRNLFRMEEQGDRRYFKGLISDAVLDQVPSLPNRRYISYCNGEHQVCGG